jgi:hypothetical protein
MKDTDCTGRRAAGSARGRQRGHVHAFGAILPGCGSPTSPSDVASPTASGHSQRWDRGSVDKLTPIGCGKRRS